MAMTFTDGDEVRREAHAKYSDQDRAEYEAGYAEAGLALEIADMVYNARMDAGLSQTELAKRAGMTQSAVSLVEGGGRVPTLETLARIAKAVDRGLRVEFAAAEYLGR
ncbi:MAG: helix-turn-helix domain-containing protein [Bifidobacteriaceae bacterium]|jgi:ribosome-binding protein aMBF1 (putative translation factor)|nr:helix-turn-helix domain-containing protein [Bifidobacteriaceae bacterium]